MNLEEFVPDLPDGSTAAVDRFLQELFLSALGVDVSSSQPTGEDENPGLERSVRGLNGTESAGYRWTERTCLETTALPMQITLQTHGLPDMQVRWEYALQHDGQAGYSRFQSGTVRVQFATAEAQSLFRSVWRKQFGTEPEGSSPAR